MATGHPRNYLQLSGRLVKDPTSLAAAFPHGGTALGDARLLRFELGPGYDAIRAEEFGGVAVEFLHRTPEAVLATVLREYDSDAIGAIFPQVATGATTGKAVISGKAFGAGHVSPGALASARAFKLLVSPVDREFHPALVIYNAIPLIDVAAALQFELSQEFGLAVVFRAVPNSSGQLYSLGMMDDLVL